jgi:hypothetical protein
MEEYIIGTSLKSAWPHDYVYLVSFMFHLKARAKNRG